MDTSKPLISLEKEQLMQEIPMLCMSLGIHKSPLEQQQMGQTQVNSKFKNQPRNYLLSHMPVSLYPYEMTSQTFQKIKRLHRIWQYLIVRVATSPSFLQKTLRETIKHDEFVSRFYQLYLKFPQNGYGVFASRIDYMGDNQPRLIQFNTMAVGLLGISDRIQELAMITQQHRQVVNPTYPVNRDFDQLLSAMEQIIKAKKMNGKQDIIVMVVAEKQFNFGDQNLFHLECRKRGYNFVRLTVQELSTQIDYRIHDNEIYLQSFRVSFIYFRTLYSPSHFTEKIWQLRELIEKSNAIKIPSIGVLLSNFKRVQAELAKKSVLEEYLTSEQAQLILEASGQIYDFENPKQVDSIIQKAKTGEYVLKENREGGGHNHFGLEGYNKILSLDREQLKQYILMRRVPSIVRDNWFITKHTFHYVKATTSEVGTFGACAYKGSQIIYNQYSGIVTRTKKQADNEGGVARDLAVISGTAVGPYE